jgi:hypothetical protein
MPNYVTDVKGYNPGREGVQMGVQLTDGIRLVNYVYRWQEHDIYAPSRRSRAVLRDPATPTTHFPTIVY